MKKYKNEGTEIEGTKKQLLAISQEIKHLSKNLHIEENLEHMSAARRKRKELREKLKLQRIEARFQRKQARLSKRNAKKLSRIYKDISPEEVNEINKIAPYTGAMADQLQADGVQVNNPEDDVEVTAKFAEQYAAEETGMSEPEAVENLEKAYCKGREYYESFEDYEHAERNGKKNILGLVFAGLGGAVKGVMQKVQDKKAQGEELTPTEEKMLNVKKQADAQMKKEVQEKGNLELGKLFPLLAVALVILLVVKSK